MHVTIDVSHENHVQSTFSQNVVDSCLQSFPFAFQAEAGDVRCHQRDGIVPARHS